MLIRLMVGTGVVLAFTGPSCLASLWEASPTSPSPVVMSAFGGSWSSVASTTIRESCKDVRWAVTEVSGISAQGSFSATCYGTLQVVGVATATLAGSVVNWTAIGTGTSPGVLSCPVSISGTATLEGTQVRIPYSGTTCLGPASGTEILRKP